jgi:hypothetical protein
VATSIQPPTSTVPSSGGAPNSLRMLHGSVSEMASDPPEISDPRPRKKMRTASVFKDVQTGGRPKTSGPDVPARNGNKAGEGVETVETEHGKHVDRVEPCTTEPRRTLKRKKRPAARSGSTSIRAYEEPPASEKDSQDEPGRAPFGRNATAGPACVRERSPSTRRPIEATPNPSRFERPLDVLTTPAPPRRTSTTPVHLRTPVPITPLQSRQALTPISARRPGTIEDYAGEDGGAGGYATAEALPLDPKKRVEERKKFMAVDSVKGKGPFGYYQNGMLGVSLARCSVFERVVDVGFWVGAAVNISQRRATGVFKTPFNVPLPKEISQQVGEISVSPVKAKVVSRREWGF